MKKSEKYILLTVILLGTIFAFYMHKPVKQFPINWGDSGRVGK